MKMLASRMAGRTRNWKLPMMNIQTARVSWLG